MDIGNKIKQLRQKANLTQEQLGDCLGISAQSVSKWENSITMPDITLLPLLSGALGVTIDELFDLTTEQKLQRIEKRLDIEAELSDSVFEESRNLLTELLERAEDRRRVLSLLARLYHHRAESDLGKVSRYAREAILLAPEVKDCQWLLQKANGAEAWDWNCSNHTDVINFYKTVIDSDTGTPKTPLPYYYLIDNLLADHRTKEAESYLEIVKTLPAHRPFLIPVYRAYIALARFDAETADRIMEEALQEFSDDPGFLFETAQYHAQKCEYEKAIVYYEQAWALEEDQKPRFTDELDGIATVYEILGDTEKAVETVDRKIACLREEWGYRDGDAVILEAEEQKKRLLK
ncbi:MAG: helix-turn-helix domain-containing protein [Ruminococcaceae bacterium]|nr:helix-turn-helix domain-containing protein [Oscillospiraceae bacterium]